MSDKELKELIGLLEGLRKKLKGDREASRAFLVRAGIFTEKGNLRKPYKELKKRYSNGG